MSRRPRLAHLVRPERSTRWLTSPRLPAGLALLACLLCLPSLTVGWQLDDYYHRLVLTGQAPGNPSVWKLFSTEAFGLDTAACMAVGAFPWWTSPELSLSFLRPVAILTHRLDYRLWPESAVLMHLHSLAWLAGLVAMATLTYRRWLGGGVFAGLAALAFAMDDTLGLPAGWLANRNAVIAGAFAFTALWAHDRAIREGWRPGRWVAPLALALALFAGEIAAGVVPFLVGYVLFLDPAGVRRGLLRAAPLGLVVGAWVAVYASGGHGARGSAQYVEPLSDPEGFTQAFAERAPLLVLGAWTPIPADLGGIAPPALRRNLWLAGLGTLAVGLLLLTPLLRRDAVARALALGTAGALVPAAATLPSSRLLLFVAFGSFGLLARWLQGRAEGAAWVPRPRAWRALAVGAVGVAALSHLVFAPPLLAFNSWSAKGFGNVIARDTASLPKDPELARQTLVMVNVPDYLLYATNLPLYSHFEGTPKPRRIRALAQGGGAVEVTRLDGRTLLLEAEQGLIGGQLGWLFWNRPFVVGDKVALEDLTVSVRSVDGAGIPTAVTVRFGLPLDDPSLRWVAWDGNGFAPFEPPSLGAMTLVPGARGPFDL